MKTRLHIGHWQAQCDGFGSFSIFLDLSLFPQL
jgi:hypothetical protein